ncbi:roadblock/LC7 domain-containing protein [Streptomyces sp. WI04-05B]|uniref:roadblock/LC7 domain-containing protein n=1 Tax=Streptomyces TaxID=1883 RepID=UPI0029B53759|nr:MULTISPECIES: roadblock/LC7 domain-containing protein [unclassified Streptomyces]MDX2544328.1 roadblock/LC7 domain-containing protein [Streptomyces sp. WI04-05B]MDX2588603.1 roadblock/LC7 domain-containing protein [Streptomyces sp. WI04-05A]MDX3750470.1 roadblock/LC7 domain-containing protein [Streptomyces sp. AK08-02]
MAAEAEVMDELRRLRARVPQLTGALAASVDGLVLVQDTPGVEPETVAALTATALSVAVRMADATGQGDFRELLVRGVYGYVATYAAGRTAVLTLLAQDRVNVGRLHLEGRRAGLRIGELVDAAAETRSPPTVAEPATGPIDPAAPPMPTAAPAPMPTRTRTPRAPRTPTTTPNARTTTTEN